MKLYDKVLESEPGLASAWYNKGVALIALYRYNEAMYAFDKAMEINPKEDLAWHGKGYILILFERFDEALNPCHVEIRGLTLAQAKAGQRPIGGMYA